MPTSTLRLRIFDGSRQPFAAPANFLVTIIDGNQTTHVSKTFPNQNDLTFTLPYFEGAFGDHYRVIVSADGYRQAGYAPLILSNAAPTTLDLMLVRTDVGYSFANARYTTASITYPFIAAAEPPPTPSARPATISSSSRRSPSPVC
jgi:hypothetical protein